MSIVASFVSKSANILSQTGILSSIIGCRHASKKTGGSTRNRGNVGRPKHRGLKVRQGQWVSAGSILVLQRQLHFLPGLNVGFGKNGTLFALEHGEVVVTCEKWNPDLDHTWVQRLYGGRDFTNVYKKYLNVLAEPQHNRFKLVDTI